MVKIGVLASGRGSNFQAIIDSVRSGYLRAEIAVLISDRSDAYALERARQGGIESIFLSPGDFSSKEEYFRAIAEKFRSRGVGLIALAGFMRIVGRPLIDAFPDRILNIHPALLPAFPGLHGQRQQLSYGVRIAGCTVHFVDEGMDTGPIIVQAAVPCFSDDTEESLSSRILACEHRIYPYAIRLFVDGRLRMEGRRVIVEGERQGDAFMISPLPE